ncbi:hypothetical protein STEG23_005626 [Scotinomys teguina]
MPGRSTSSSYQIIESRVQEAEVSYTEDRSSISTSPTPKSTFGPGCSDPAVGALKLNVVVNLLLCQGLGPGIPKP